MLLFLQYFSRSRKSEFTCNLQLFTTYLTTSKLISHWSRQYLARDASAGFQFFGRADSCFNIIPIVMKLQGSALHIHTGLLITQLKSGFSQVERTA